jgi:tryptophan 2,3-dioxygenase
METATVPARDETTYSSYLKLPAVLGAQQPASSEHDEMLFIVVHQASELWLKLCLHELSAARSRIAADDLRPAFKMFARVARAQAQLIQSWDVLATMTPSDYARFRPSLGTSSGFQSYQYRLLEFIAGAKNGRMLEPHARDADVHRRLAAELAAPSIYDETLRFMARRGFALPYDRLERDFAIPHAPSPEVEACWREVYRCPDQHWDLYELAEKLVDLEYRLQQWRFAHLKTVERIIGFKQGTGGTAGAPYLEAVLKQRFFPELMSVRASL